MSCFNAISLWPKVSHQSWAFPNPPGQAIDSSLSDIGMQQAEAAGKYLKDVKFTNVFVSDMARARQVSGDDVTDPLASFRI